MSKFKAILTENGRGKVFIDDKDISNYCTSLSLDANIGEKPILILELIGDIEIEGDADIILCLSDGSQFPVKAGG